MRKTARAGIRVRGVQDGSRSAGNGASYVSAFARPHGAKGADAGIHKNEGGGDAGGMALLAQPAAAVDDHFRAGHDRPADGAIGFDLQLSTDQAAVDGGAALDPHALGAADTAFHARMAADGDRAADDKI